jgi:hypothetical protein
MGGYGSGWKIKLVLAEVSCPSSQSRPVLYFPARESGERKQRDKERTKQDDQDAREAGVSEPAERSCRPNRNRPGQGTAITGSAPMPDTVFRKATFQVGQKGITSG